MEKKALVANAEVDDLEIRAECEYTYCVIKMALAVATQFSLTL